MRIWVDVTTLASTSPPAAGIPRVELNLADHLVRGGAGACVYEAALGRFAEVPRDAFDRLVALHRSSTSIDMMELDLRRRALNARGGRGLFDRGDALVTCGFNWAPRFGNMPHVYALRDAIGLVVVATCYDLIPILFPRFAPAIATFFPDYVAGLVRHADHVLCVSRSTERDLVDWSGRLGLRPRATSVLPLGVDLREHGGPVDARVAAIAAEGCLLFVSTIEERKNHRVLCSAYATLAARGVALPRLVFVGRRGHGGDVLFAEIDADPTLRERVVELSDLGDRELAALYRGCRFTLYPSWYEGWGLPVSESLAYGRLCVASDRASLPEAGGAFCDTADPGDAGAWADRIAHWLHDPQALARRERDIAERYRPPTWSAAADHVRSVLGG